MIVRPPSRRNFQNLRSSCFHSCLQRRFGKKFERGPKAAAFIVLEHPEGFGGNPKDLTDTVHGIFFDQERAEDFVRGMIRYVHSYESRELLLSQGRARDVETDTVWFEIVKKEIYG